MDLYFFEPGIYTAKPVKITYGETSTKKTPYWRIAFLIIGGSYDGEPIAYDGYLTEGATGITLRAVEACGALIKGKELAELFAEVEEFETLNGFGAVNVNLVVVSEYNSVIGQEVSRVRFVNPLSGSSSSLSGRNRALAALEKFAKATKKGDGGAAPASSTV